MDSRQKHQLERERSRLVLDLAKVNRLLRSSDRQSRRDCDWDFDPRGVSA
jgi:hypothetical protein